MDIVAQKIKFHSERLAVVAQGNCDIAQDLPDPDWTEQLQSVGNVTHLSIKLLSMS